MALSGNLGFVPLDEVLRLLARSGQTGAVEVRGENVRGRVFVSTKGISLATTFEDTSLRSHLLNSGYVDEGTLAEVEAGNTSLPANREDDSALVELLKEMTIEGLYQMQRHGTSFEVDEGATSSYASPKPFDLEATLDAVGRRGDEWADVERLVSNMHTRILINRDLGDRDEVTLSREAWMLLSELGAGSTVSEMAARLGTTEFWTAKVASDMTERSLLVIDNGAVEQSVPETPQEPVAHTPEPAAPAGAEASDEDVDPNESWWVEPDKDQAPAAGDESEAPAAEVEQPHAEGGDFTPRLGRYSPFAGDEGEEEEIAPFDPEAAFEGVEEDTEAFLEKVFSELEESEEDEESETEGHGLLRRRRMGSLLQDQGNDD